MKLVEAVDRISRGDYSPDDVAVLGKIFNRYLTDDRLSINVAFNGLAHKGLRLAVREHRWRNHIGEAVRLAGTPGVSTASIVRALREEIQRQDRSTREPMSPFGKAVAAAMKAHPAAGISDSALWTLVAEIRADG